MIFDIFKKFSGRHNRKFLKECRPIVEQINKIEQIYQSLSPEELRAKTSEFRKRLGTGETLDDLLPEAFAAVKNAARRLCGEKVMVCEHEIEWNMIHFDVQLIGGMALHRGRIAEMATGEGKTLVATLPLYLNALNGRNAQLITVNDYLARRDSEWMGHLYERLGLTVGCIQQQMPNDIRREKYLCDITYGTASEFGFDYLRDNGMATRKEDQVQREHWYCIVDEVDSILIDEARTPLIISGPTQMEREIPFMEHKPAVESLVNVQKKLCKAFIEEAELILRPIFGQKNSAKRNGDGKKTILSKESLEKVRYAGTRMLQVKLGDPKNEKLGELLKIPDCRKLLDQTEVELFTDYQKEQFYRLKEELYFSIDERQHQADLTERGRNHINPDDPDAFCLPDLAAKFAELEKDERFTPEQRENIKHGSEAEYIVIAEKIHAISQLLRAYVLYQNGKDYIKLDNNKVMIVDENTGRIMLGRRWSDGLHQAIETKEGVPVASETHTYATITIQNYFRMYEKLAGMTGTAETEAAEFNDIYRLAVQVVPTHRPCIRIDKNDCIFKTQGDKFKAVVSEIKAAHARGQPVLVGTASVESSELLSGMLKRMDINHAVLNAKYHAQEADIVARAGQRGAVTIATNMAGRGTDIKLGEGVRFKVTCGLHKDPKKKKPNTIRYTLTEINPGKTLRCDSDSPEIRKLELKPSLLAVNKNEEWCNVVVETPVKDGLYYKITCEKHPDLKKHASGISQCMLTEMRLGTIKRQCDAGSETAALLCLTPQTKEAGGLYVIGTERHQSRRVDRQLRGRCSRQGDPGLTKFFLSLEDDLMRLFLQGNLASRLMEGSMNEGEELQHPLLNHSIESAQKKVEQQNYTSRKRLLQYDDVLNAQRKIIYGIRNAAIHAERPKDLIFEQIDEEIKTRIAVAGIGEKSGATQSSLENLIDWLNRYFPISLKISELDGNDPEATRMFILERIKEAYAVKESTESPDALGSLERYVVINTIDQHWQEHLTGIESLRQSIGLRSYGQKDPLVEYKSDAYKYFKELMNTVRQQICTSLFRSASSLQAFENMLSVLGGGEIVHTPPAETARRDEIEAPMYNPTITIGMLDGETPCPCGSGKRYDKCHGL